MENRPVAVTSSADNNVWTWIILAGILVLSALVGAGALTLLNSTQQGQLPTGSQSSPAPR